MYRSLVRTIAVSIMAGAFSMFGSGTAQASCLYIDRNDIYHSFVNTCSVGIDFDFNDEGSCAGWSCSGYVNAGGRFSTGGVTGDVDWVECRSPGGIGDVIAVCDSAGRCSCKD